MVRSKPVTLQPKGRKAIARYYGGAIVILWDGGMATKDGATVEEFDALESVLEPAALAGYVVIVERNGAP
jgi:hypothetical protein